ncbi:plasmid pRiA4b ORF-3 family protein [Actinokineospora sp.]|uniref:plasmid pRiA4b ORF-3 family protein n=1 Tax=Actinokineospora sp. TaxID=1872133 RepID=UPI003D6B7CAA
MSPVSRGRKTKAKRETALRSVPMPLTAPETCDCPACVDGELDPDTLIDDLIAGGADLLDAEDPLDAEMIGASFVAVGELAGADFTEVLAEGIIPAIEARQTPGAFAMLLAIGSVTDEPIAARASSAAGRLAEAWIAQPKWAAELSEPVTASECWTMSDDEGAIAVLACTFHRASRSHAVMMTVDQFDCGAAVDIYMVEAEQLPEALAMIEAESVAQGSPFTRAQVDPAEFRWQVDKALDARAVHDAEDDPDDEPPFDEDGPNYGALALLVRARMNVLPVSDKPKAAHDGDLADLSPDLLRGLFGGGSLGGGSRGIGGRGFAAKLPAKRKKSDGPAPVYQIKVGLRGAKPPIWRRLEVPADIGLPKLHAVIQIAFDWDDSHMHLFETAFGEFGRADAQLGHRSADSVTLEQVAPEAGGKLRYLYDFGDSWEHDILVEKVLDRDKSARYPRCTGGRRAAPPEDCGGVWGYEYLVDILADPAHDEHEDRMEWLGLDKATDFDPAAFDAAAITEELSTLR